MGLLRRTPYVPGPTSDEPTVDLTPERCDACLRTGVPLVKETHYGLAMRLCPSPYECRCNWPREA